LILLSFLSGKKKITKITFFPGVNLKSGNCRGKGARPALPHKSCNSHLLCLDTAGGLEIVVRVERIEPSLSAWEASDET
jgi:hypothetical protein